APAMATSGDTAVTPGAAWVTPSAAGNTTSPASTSTRSAAGPRSASAAAVTWMLKREDVPPGNTVAVRPFRSNVGDVAPASRVPSTVIVADWPCSRVAGDVREMDGDAPTDTVPARTT